MKKQQIAAQLYTLRNSMQNEEGIRDSLKKVADMGYGAVQVSGLGPIHPKLLKEILDENKLSVCATHNSIDRLRNDSKKVIEEHLLWGCKYVGLGSMPNEYRDSYEGYKRFADEFSKIGKIYSNSDLKLIYHNHNFEFQKFNGTLGLELILDKANEGSFEMEIDTYWVQAGGADPVEWIYKVKGKMSVVHFKDMAIIDKAQVFAEIGEGNLNWNKIIKACDEIGVLWAAIEQDICIRDPFDSLKLSFKNMEAYYG